MSKALNAHLETQRRTERKLDAHLETQRRTERKLDAQLQNQRTEVLTHLHAFQSEMQRNFNSLLRRDLKHASLSGMKYDLRHTSEGTGRGFEVNLEGSIGQASDGRGMQSRLILILLL